MLSATLLIPLAQRMMLIWFFAYVFSQTRLFWNIVNSRVTFRDKVIFVVAFGAISIVGTHLGIPLADGAIANIRPIGAIVAGFIGGPGLGAAVGLVSGLHRYSLGGFTALACGIATVFEGLSGGIIGLKFKKNFLDLRGAFVAGVIGEILQVGIVLLVAKPFSSALDVERAVAIPMIVVNTIGVMGFSYIIRDAFVKHNGMIMTQFGRFVEIERRMAHAVAQGLSQGAVKGILEDLMGRTELKGMFVLQNNQLLSYCGIEQEVQMAVVKWQETLGHMDGSRATAPQQIKLKSGMMSTTYYCVPLEATLLEQGFCLGVKLMGRNYYDTYVISFTDRLAELMANQIKQFNLSKIQDAADLAQLKALKAQIQPHFLFNALSTISSFCRTDPNKARDLILDLAQYFRRTLDVESQIVPLQHEIELVTAYLHIEKARFGNRLNVLVDIAQAHMDLPIPILSIQPLVENAVKYGVAPNQGGATVTLRSQLLGNELVVTVENTGALGALGDLGVTPIPGCSDGTTAPQGGCGKALDNIKERLMRIYGSKASFVLQGPGTAQSVSAILTIPIPNPITTLT